MSAETSQATHPDILRQRIMDSRIAKSEHEWWAARHIAELEAVVKVLHEEAEYNAVRVEVFLKSNRKLYTTLARVLELPEKWLKERVMKAEGIMRLAHDSCLEKCATEVKAALQEPEHE